MNRSPSYLVICFLLLVVVVLTGLLAWRPAAPDPVPTVIEVWPPTPVGGSAVPVITLTPHRVLRDGEPVFSGPTPEGSAGTWKIVLVHGTHRTAVLAD